MPRLLRKDGDEELMSDTMLGSEQVKVGLVEQVPDVADITVCWWVAESWSLASSMAFSI